MFYVLQTECVFLAVCNWWLLLPSLMTENIFWTSEQWLLTKNWQMVFFPLTSSKNPTWRTCCFLDNWPKSQSIVWREDGEKEDGGRAAFWEFVGYRINLHCLLFY
jgi:hypothetical protein